MLEEAPALGGGMVFGGGTQNSEGPGEPALWPLGVLLWAWPSGEPHVRVRHPSASQGLSQTAAASVLVVQSSALSGAFRPPECLLRLLAVSQTARCRCLWPAQLWTALCVPRASSVPGRRCQDLCSLTARCHDKLWPAVPQRLEEAQAGWGRGTRGWLLPGPGQRAGQMF